MKDAEYEGVELHKFGTSNWTFVRWAILVFGLFATISLVVSGTATVFQLLATGIPTAAALVAIVYLRIRPNRHEQTTG